MKPTMKWLCVVVVCLLACTCVALVACNGQSGKNANSRINFATDVFTWNEAYAYAEELGYSGTLGEFVAMLTGKDGTNGADGIGVATLAVSADGHLLVTLSNEQTIDCGAIPTVKGDAGRGIKRTYIDAEGYLVVVYTDDVEEKLDKVRYTQVSDEWESDETHHWRAELESGDKYAYAEHVWGEGTLAKEATEEEEGVMVYACPVCGKMKTEMIEKVVHTYGEWIVDTPATDLKEGAMHRECADCGYIQYQAIPALTKHVVVVTSNLPDAGEYSTGGAYDYLENVDLVATASQGYVFIGWYCGDALLSAEAEYNYRMWDKDAEIQARFDYVDYNLQVETTNAARGLVKIESDYAENEATVLPYKTPVTVTAFTKTDARFLGWYNQERKLMSTDAVYTFAMPNYDYVLSARWGGYGIAYDLNGGTQNSGNPDEYEEGADVITLLAPTMEGEEFLGWKYNGEYITTIDPATRKDYELVAVWTKLVNYIGTGDTAVVEDGVRAIGTDAFKGHSELKSITLPSTITSIGYGAFADCSGLQSVYYNGDLADWCAISFGSGLSNPTGISARLYLNGTPLTGEVVIPDSVTAIPPYMFKNSTVTKVTLPSNLTKIGRNAFDSCTGLTGSLAIPGSVTSIGDSAFYGCTGLTGALVIPNSVTSLGGSAFYGCTGFTSVTLSNQLTSIGSKAFYGCSGLAGALVIPDSVRNIDAHAFYKCDRLTSLTIGSNVSFISSGAFSCCTGLTGSIVIPDSVTTLSNEAFYKCSNVTAVTLGSRVSSIDGSTFKNCSNLASINIPASIRSIASGAFEGCDALSSAVFASGYWQVSGYVMYTAGLGSGLSLPKDITENITLDLADTATNAMYLRNTYVMCRWTRM